MGTNQLGITLKILKKKKMWASRKAKCPSLQAAAAAYVLRKNMCAHVGNGVVWQL
jgi:hypothetical protein